VQSKFDYNEVAVVKRSMKQYIESQQSHCSNLSRKVLRGDDTPHAQTRKVKRIRNEEILNTEMTKNRNCKQVLALGYEELYPNVPPAVYDEYDIDKFVPSITIKDRVRQLTTGSALLCLLCNHYKVYIRKSDKKLYPCLYEINNQVLHYGHRYHMNSVCGDAKLNHNHRTHAPVSTSENAANIVVLTKRYKQCPKKIDALTNSLDKYNTSVVDRQFNIDYGKFDGRITIMGSGGSHKLMGNFAPTTKTTKHDSLVQIGAGQNKVRAINIRLEKLAIDQSVQAVFLNEEHYYGQKPSTIQTPRTLRFLGYFVFFESRFTTGEEYSKIADEFNQPTANNFHHLTFRLHPHLRVEGKPFIPSLMELDQLTKGSDTNYKKIVLEHDDHSNIFFDCVGLDDWKTCHHKVTIEDVILQMIVTGELNKHILTNSDNDKEDEIANVGVDVNDGFSSRIQIEEENLLGNGYEEAVATNDNESYYDKKDSDNNESDMVEDSSPSDSDYDDKRSDHNKSNMISADR
jgi:hypothetical protein